MTLLGIHVLVLIQILLVELTVPAPVAQPTTGYHSVHARVVVVVIASISLRSGGGALVYLVVRMITCYVTIHGENY